MRKKPEPKTRICELCGKEYQSSAPISRFCKPCGKEHEKIRKKEWNRKKYGYKPKVKHTDPCCVCGEEFSAFYDGKPYCNKHWLRMYTHGDVEEHPRERTNKYIEHDDYISIICKHGEEILIDKCDFEKLKLHSWCISKTGYPVTNIDGKTTKLHRYLLDLTDPDVVVDHKNHNPLDNRRCNIRICTQRENSMNQSAAKNSTMPIGIRKMKSGKYEARIFVDGKSIGLGLYVDIEDAIKARNEAEIKYRGEFAQHLYSNS